MAQNTHTALGYIFIIDNRKDFLPFWVDCLFWAKTTPQHLMAELHPKRTINGWTAPQENNK